MSIASSLRIAALLLLAAGAVAPAGVRGASTDISNQPLITMPDVKAKPNVMFILDSSGSMDDTSMPDQQGEDSGRYGYTAAQCNGLAYNPALIYTPPLNADGTPYPNANFSAAWVDGYRTGDGSTVLGGHNSQRIVQIVASSVSVGTGSKTFTINEANDINLASGTFTVGQVIVLVSEYNRDRSMTGTVTSWNRTGNDTGTLIVNVADSSGSGSNQTWNIFRGARYFNYTGSQPRLSWTFDSAGDVVTNTFYNECRSYIGSSPGSGVFTPAYVNALSSDATNYANWYAYYRKRILLMRTAVGQAFNGLDDGYRIGFTSIRDTGITDGTNNFRDVKTFDTTQKANFYTSLYGENANDYTPLRASLSKVGRYFAKKATGSQSYDPMEYACQRNYAILSTDGYWNNNIETGSYVPKKLDGTAVENQDYDLARPMYDGATATTTLTRTRYRVDNVTAGGNCANNRYRVRVNQQTSTNGGTTWTDGSVTTTCHRLTDNVPGYVPPTTVDTLRGQTVYSLPTSSTNWTGGSSDHLADVAAYYYRTDLRNSALDNCTSTTSGSSQNVCADIVPTSGRDDATHQHMTTFTIGLGVSGTLAYDKNYLTQASGAYVDLKNGPTNWPVVDDFGNNADARKIDDMWHAAVNGRGQYYSALDATALQQAITGIVNQIQAVNGAASAAVTNRLELVAGGGNYAYQASYTTAEWFGSLEAYPIDGTTGTLGTTAAWSAQATLDAKAENTRNIKFSSSGALTDFTYANLQAAGRNALFDNLCSKTVVATQCATLTGAQLALANTGSNLVSYLRGNRAYEGTNSANPLYRTRAHLLGDIVNSSPVFVGPPLFAYTDTGYASFKTSRASRTPVIYVGANDGMLHAFDAANGNELWAFIPTAVLPKLYKLADKDYASRHDYYVDGAPVVGDVYDTTAGAWKTILVGGLNAGGNAYYALDITDPASPSLLWEFTDTNLGLSFGNPIIVKRNSGKWVVVFASGYNNTAGDGQGRLFVLDAITGVKEKTVDGTTNLDLATATGIGSASDPSGLAKINAWIADSTDNKALRFYGGDLKGNLWRFDIDDLVEPKHSALRLARFETSAGNPQAITIQPRLKLVSGQPVVILASGQYLGTTDIANDWAQGVAVIKDPMDNSNWGIVRNNTAVKVSTVTMTDPSTTSPTATLLDDVATITASSPVVVWGTDGGWRFDLPVPKERVVTSIAIGGNKMVVASAIPSGDACTTGGASRLYVCEIPTGDCTGELYSSSSLIVGLSVITTEDGSLVVLIRDSTGRTVPRSILPGGSGGIGTAHRTSWRELVN